VELSLTDEDRQLYIMVKDTGCGINENISNRLFDAFYQANNTKKASQTGFGIGLYVSKKLAVAHAGSLSYVSTEEMGSTFKLVLPRNKLTSMKYAREEGSSDRQSIIHELVEESREEEDKAVDNKSKVIDRIVSGLPTMVIVDDDAELRSYVKEIFIEQFNIFETSDGMAAFALISKELPDIVVSDVVMD
jgi:PleD family two-component response regulator